MIPAETILSPVVQKSFSREAFLDLLKAALAAQEYRFTRQTSLVWLAAYPGDLQVGLCYAQALQGENRTRQAITILDGLCQADPEFGEAMETLYKLEQQVRPETARESQACLMALGRPAHESETIPSWGRELWLARQSLSRGDLNQADQLVNQALGAELPTPLAAVTHLQILNARKDVPLEARRSLAVYYHQRWPNCLVCTLLLADWLMDGGQSDQAVSLLHQAAARDVSGQVAKRLWGAAHPYRTLWPDQLELAAEISPPASVASVLGWNRLTDRAGDLGPTSSYDQPAQKTAATQPSARRLRAVKQISQQETIAMGTNNGRNGGSDEAPVKPDNAPTGDSSIDIPTQPAYSTLPESLRSVQDELERVANRLNKPGLMSSDGRFPVLVVFSVRSALEAQYGEQGAADIENEMSRLVEGIQVRRQKGNKRSPGSLLFFADEPPLDGNLAIPPVRKSSPWEIKLALADLDRGLAKKGEMIGALLIVGGPEIVPFHHLPNPVDDEDDDVPSDNPYGTRDENYFIPEWPVGRLPGGNGNDPTSLLQALRRISQRYQLEKKSPKRIPSFFRSLFKWLKPFKASTTESFGYTAAAWRQASLTVFQPIGDPRHLLASPPLGASTPVTAGQLAPLSNARLAYFNLHGLSDTPEWYGQRDPLESVDGPDYPVALRPEDIGLNSSQNNTCTPEIVFSEGCYSANLSEKTEQTSIALKFMSSGCRAFAGSTCMSYGSISAPLSAADLLAQEFWKALREGHPVGEALRRARVQLARTMHDRQGYLDGEDQKTLISFVLYGDPLETFLPATRAAKTIRSRKVGTWVKTVCDRNGEQVWPEQLIPEEVTYVKSIVSQYLPGMVDAQVKVSCERSGCTEHGHVCPTGQLQGKMVSEKPTGRRVVTLSKKVQLPGHIYSQYARLTLDQGGKLVKLVVSR